MWAFLTIFLLTGCEPIGPGASPPDAPAPSAGILELSTHRLDFGSVSATAAEHAVSSFTLFNTGESNLTVYGLDFLGDDSPFTTDAVTLPVIAPGSELEVEIAFAPDAFGDYRESVQFNGLEELELIGHATAPSLSISAEALAFEQTNISCVRLTELTLTNDGDELLLFESFELEGAAQIALSEEPLPALLPNESMTLLFEFTPTSPGTHEATLRIVSNDPISPELNVMLRGTADMQEVTTDDFAYLPMVKTDVLFAIDSTSSTADRLYDAADDAGALSDTWAENLVDWRVAVVNGEHDCNATTLPWISPDDGIDLREALLDVFTESGAGEPMLMERVSALLERTDPGDCLGDFLREDSTLHIVFLTDADDLSEDGVESYLEAYRLQHASEDVLVSAITGIGDDCQAANKPRYAAQQTSGLLGDICAPDWDSYLPDLATLTASDNSEVYTFQLSETPALNSLELVDSTGNALKGWSYSDAPPTITLTGEDVGVELGDELTLRYLTAETCF